MDPFHATRLGKLWLKGSGCELADCYPTLRYELGGFDHLHRIAYE